MSYTPGSGSVAIVRKYLYFDAVNKTNVDRLNLALKAYKVSDTTSVSTSSTTRTNAKTYTYDTTGGLTPRKIRIRVYGYTGTGTTMYVYINIDGVDVKSGSTTSTSETLVIDYIGDIGAGAHTIKIDYYSSSGIAAVITKVYIVDSYVVTSTTATTIASVTIDPSAEYVLRYSGGFSFEVGLRCKLAYTVYRKLSANATISVDGKSGSIAVADDGDSVAGVSGALYDTYALSQNTFTISANVGASGDILWILDLKLYVQVTLRGNQTDVYATASYWSVLINEIGVVYLSARAVSLSGSSYAVKLFAPTKDGSKQLYVSGAGTDIIVNTTAVNTNQLVLYVDRGEDTNSYSAILFLYIVVI